MTESKGNIQPVDKYEFKGVGLTRREKTKATKYFEDYQNRYHIEHISDLNLLEELVYREVIQDQYKKKVANLNSQKGLENKDVVPRHIFEALNNNLEQILILKEKLGLLEDKKGDDPYKYFEILKKKFKKWREENQGSRTLICPHCSQIVLLKIRTEAWEVLKHPFFKDKILANKHLWKCYKEGKITREDIAEILGCSPDYVTWLETKIYSKPA